MRPVHAAGVTAMLMERIILALAILTALLVVLAHSFVVSIWITL
jgi:hypothetical protein